MGSVEGGNQLEHRAAPGRPVQRHGTWSHPPSPKRGPSTAAAGGTPLRHGKGPCMRLPDAGVAHQAGAPRSLPLHPAEAGRAHWAHPGPATANGLRVPHAPQRARRGRVWRGRFPCVVDCTKPEWVSLRTEFGRVDGRKQHQRLQGPQRLRDYASGHFRMYVLVHLFEEAPPSEKAKNARKY